MLQLMCENYSDSMGRLFPLEIKAGYLDEVCVEVWQIIWGLKDGGPYKGLIVISEPALRTQ